MMHYCRPAVEKFVFSRLHNHLIAMYCIKTKTLEEAFRRKVELISQRSVQDLLTALEIREKYRLPDLATPYSEAIEILKKLGSNHTPLEKLNCCLNTAASMKTAVIDYWKGREELAAMDDELPILIFVVVQAKVINFNAEVALLLDYVGRLSRFEKEQRLLINFEAAAKYIANDWEL
mmetsp:Transcript_32553/g.56318  ORF Transcript_32553/g.56318 Transcript_32553/m.56318 type:complete len:177 (+) Transcript_32553:908-1438(+)